MTRRTAVPGLLALAACIAPLAAADPPNAPADDRAKLQGVWESPAGAKGSMNIIFFDDKVGYSTKNPGAQPPATTSSSVALSPAKRIDMEGKAQFELQVAKDYSTKIDYRLDKTDLVIGVNKAEYTVARVNTRASDSAAAKKLVGTWAVTGLEAKGMSIEPKAGGLEAVVFTDDRYAWKAPGGKELLNSFFRLGEPKKGTAELDIYGLKPEVAITALLEVTGDELRIAQPLKAGAKGAGRPTGFGSTAAEILVVKAKRAK